MKNLSLVLNIVLLAAVGYLYYYSFSGKKNGKPSISNSNPSMWKDSNCNRPPIAYVELDSLNENITYIKERRKELEKDQKDIETEWENGYKELEAKKNNFLKKGASITQEEAQQFQGQLVQEQQQIDGKKQSLNQKLSEKSFSVMDDIQKKLREFLTEYNKEKKFMYILTTGAGLDYLVYKDSSLNITGDVIRGMNEKMKSGSKP
jgi:outer membrane protein